MGKRTKKDAQQDHSKRRFKERYGLRCTQRLMDHLRYAIKSGGAVKIEKQSLRVSVYEAIFTPNSTETDDITLVGKPMILRFVFDKKRKQVVTALPRNEDHENPI